MISSSQLQSLDGSATPDHRELVTRLQESTIYRDYEKAFQSMTGLPLTLRSTGSFQAPMQGAKHSSAFCHLVATRAKACSGCLMVQQKLESSAQQKSSTVECFAGLNESAVPVRLGENVIAYLQTGQVLFREATATQARHAAETAAGANPTSASLAELQAAFRRTRVMTKTQYESVLRLLEIFALHLSAVTNQLMLQQTHAEAPAVARARAFIAEHFGDNLSMRRVAQIANMSSFYFCKVFKKDTGMTFTEYLARVRVEAVKTLLLNPHKRVSEAAYEAGFQSLSQFNRVFARVTGESPTVYREHLVAPVRTTSDLVKFAA